MLEPTAAALPRTSGSGFFLRSLDAHDEDTEEWTQQGYSLLEQTGDGYSAFIFTGEPDANNEDSAVSGVFVEAEKLTDDYSDHPVFKGADDVKKLNWELEVEAASPSEARIKMSRRRWFLCMLVTGDPLNYPDRIGLALKVKSVRFCVDNSIDTKGRRGHFVSKLKVTASPRFDWREFVICVRAEPTDDSFDNSFSEQTLDTRTVGSTIGFNTGTVNTSYASAQGTTSNSIPKHGWEPAGQDDLLRSVTWTWALNYWNDKQPFSFYCPSKVRSSPNLPKLPYDLKRGLTFNKTVVEAEWAVKEEDLRFMDEIEWDITVKLYTASVKLKGMLRRVSYHESSTLSFTSKVSQKLSQ